jgi:hypothetical protein
MELSKKLLQITIANFFMLIVICSNYIYERLEASFYILKSLKFYKSNSIKKTLI